MMTLSIPGLLLLVVLAVVAAGFWVFWKVIQGIGWLVGRILRFAGRSVKHVARSGGAIARDGIHTLGALVTGATILPLAVFNLAVGRWSAAKHYGAALEDELASVATGMYRVAIGHPLRLVGLGALVAGLERRIPDIVDRAPRPARRRDRSEFPGYKVYGTLAAGGSGAQLFLARPTAETVERYRAAGRELADEVVIKSFAVARGSTLPQIVRESRALEAAGRLGLLYEHRMDDERFYYVMRYVRGEELDTATQKLHARSGPDGLGPNELSLALGYGQDLLRSLDRFHTGGLWHKDVKPANVIVSDGNAQLVDFGLVTPLASAMTLTTHGTEYYRDPEMVRLAMQGVKVHEVDGVKFDLYSAGAVLFSLFENSFPAHGSLSRITKRCPEALHWVIRRSMADLRTRYGAAWEMLDDLTVIAEADDPYAVRPADLPSFHRVGEPVRKTGREPARDRAPMGFAAAMPTPAAERVADVTPPAAHERPVAPPKTAPVVRRRRFRRVLVAATVIGVFFVGFSRALSEALHERSHASRARAVAGVRPYRLDLGRHGRADARFYENAQEVVNGHLKDALDGAVRELKRAGYAVESALEDAVESKRRAARLNRHEHDRAPEPRLLLVEDPKGGLAFEKYEKLTKGLIERGVDLMGDEESEDESYALLKSLTLNAIGVSDPADPAVMERLESLLEETSELDGILWVSDLENDDQVRGMLIERPADDESSRAVSTTVSYGINGQ